MRSAFLIGAAGRLGEAVLNRLIAEPQYSAVHVATKAPIEMGIRQLSGAADGQWPRVDDAYLVIHQPDEPFASSYFGRHDAFSTIEYPSLETVAPTLEALGIKRICILAPLSAYQQMSGAAATILGEGEMAFYRARFEAIHIVRPTPLSEPSRGKSFMQRLLNGYMSLNRFAMPKAFEPIRSIQVADIAVTDLVVAQPGLSILTADKLRQKLYP